MVGRGRGVQEYIQDGVLSKSMRNRDLVIVLEVGGTTETVTVTL